MASAAPARTRSPFPRRRLLATGALGLAAAATLGAVAPASAAVLDDGDLAAQESAQWTEEFLTRPETREGFVLEAMDDWQVANATFIIAVVKGHELGEEVAVVALITAIVEAWLYNYEPAVDADSGGLFQQRPSMGWGTYDEVRHKKHALDAFLGLGEHSQAPGLLQVVPDVASWEPGAAAQAVQASAHPERYTELVGAAREIWDRFADDVEPYTA
ncbi:hypothetical protein CFK38_08830 [Brachybacterium vulturis]|uniref:Peptidoglycan-binding protein n=1 Tax=Brachybacterium vulturis TaxID=2017484 RepID=A0A291GN34_9MICO|nr:hypothetical protein [Brachybacterium vulturis]ATG51618.1 hypothetical protein CFK38_08830 [Brachybacterium vulturis]